MKTRKTPQLKKAESLAKDRRNTYGENDKASRKNIPKAKASAERAFRHAAGAAVRNAKDPGTNDDADRKLADARLKRRAGFKKTPDTPLGAFLDQRDHRNAKVDGRDDRVRAKRSGAKPPDRIS